MTRWIVPVVILASLMSSEVRTAALNLVGTSITVVGHEACTLLADQPTEGFCSIFDGRLTTAGSVLPEQVPVPPVQ
jgi:hypothetical protein